MDRKIQIFTAVFVACLITANIIATKVADFWGFYMPAGIIVFPITYIIGDIVTEVYGYKQMRRIILIGFIANVISTAFIMISISLPSAPFWENQNEFQVILSQTPRILGASLLGYLAGSISNSWSMEWIKGLTKGKYLWVRTIGSTIIGEGIDTIIFLLVDFVYLVDSSHLLEMMRTQWLFKVRYETVATPITYAAISYFKKTKKG